MTYLVKADGESSEWLADSLETLVLSVESYYPDAERLAVFEEHGACLWAKWRAGAEIKTAWNADVDQHDWTNDKVPSCYWCGEWTVLLRALHSASDLIVSQEYVCKDCFSNPEIGWDDLGAVVNEWAAKYARQT